MFSIEIRELYVYGARVPRDGRETVERHHAENDQGRDCCKRRMEGALISSCMLLCWLNLERDPRCQDICEAPRISDECRL